MTKWAGLEKPGLCLSSPLMDPTTLEWRNTDIPTDPEKKYKYSYRSWGEMDKWWLFSRWMVLFALQYSQHSIVAGRAGAAGLWNSGVCRIQRFTAGSCLLMRDFPSHKLRWGKTNSPKAFLRVEVLQKHSQPVHSTQVWKSGRREPGAALFVVGSFTGGRKATLPVCSSEESLIKLICC